jgi:hypothetical protein
MSNYFQRIETQLLDAVERQARSRSTVSRWPWQKVGHLVRGSAGWGLVAASIVVVVLVVIMALGVGASKPHTSPASGGAGSSRAQLVRVLGVLSRPQTPAARAFARTGWPQPPRGPGSHIRPDRPLIRLTTMTPWGAKVFVVPLTPPANPTLARSLGETVALWVQGIGWSDYSRASDITAGNAWGPQTTVRRPGGRLETRFFELVPNGVAKVVFYRLSALPRPGAPARISGSVAATVHNNIAVFRMQVAAAGAFPIDAAWYAANGRLVRRLGANNPEPRPGTTADVLGANGIASVKFGASAAVVRAEIDTLLRQPGGPYARGGSCGLDHRIQWWDDRAATGLSLLTTYFRRSRFVGYEYGDYETQPRAAPAGPTLATTRGLRIGDTPARATELYGGAFTTSAAQGGSWSLRTAGGSIDGYLSGVPGHGGAGGQIVVATIDAGDVGCSALSP